MYHLDRIKKGSISTNIEKYLKKIHYHSMIKKIKNLGWWSGSSSRTLPSKYEPLSSKPQYH
jgi:hypothetical protein